MKKLVAALLAAVMVFSMVACGNGSSDNGDTTAAQTDAGTDSANGETAGSGEDVEAELAVTWWGSQTRSEMTMQVLDMYHEQHPNISFNAVPGEWSNYFTKLATDAAGNIAPDLVAMDYKYLNQFSSNGTLLALDEYVEDGTLNLDDVEQSVVDSGRYVGDGLLYAICSGTNAPALLYDEQVVEEAGVTIEDNMDFDTFVDICRTIYEKTGVHTRLQYRSETYLQFILRGMGKALYNDDNNAFGCEEADLEAYFEIFQMGTEEGWLVPQTLFTEIDPNTVEQDPLVYYSSNDTRSWCALAWSNQATAYSAAAPEGTTLGITTWAAEDTTLANYIKPSQFWSVTTDSEYPAEAVKVIDYITNDVDCNNVLLAEKGIPISKTVAEAIAPNLDEVQQEVSTFVNDVVTPNSSEIDPPAPSSAAEMYTLCDDLVEEVCFGQTSPADAAARLYTEGNEILARATETAE